MDINQLLASEQLSLLRAKFAPIARIRNVHFATAAALAASLGKSMYPHRRIAAELLA